MRRKTVVVAVTVVVMLMLVITGAQAQEQSEPLISNVFYDADIRSALQDIATQAKVVIVPDDTVQGIVSLELKNAPLEKALEMVLAGGSYAWIKANGYYLVGAPIPTNPNFDKFCVTEVVKLSNVKAEDVGKLFGSFYQPYLKTNSADNLIFIVAPPEIAEAIKGMIEKIDTIKPQIAIEVVIVDISKTQDRGWTIDWSKSSEAEIPGVEEYSFAGCTLGYATTIAKSVMLQLKALVERGKANIRANPRLVTTEGKEATLHVGQREYYLMNTSDGSGGWYSYNRLEEIESGIKLRILPRIGKNGELIIEFTPEVSDVVGETKSGLPRLNIRTINTTVRVKDGETIIAGGLAYELEREMRKKVPLLGDLPLIGSFFRSTSQSKIKTEVTILITPHIIKEGQSLGGVSTTGQQSLEEILTEEEQETEKIIRERELLSPERREEISRSRFDRVLKPY